MVTKKQKQQTYKWIKAVEELVPICQMYFASYGFTIKPIDIEIKLNELRTISKNINNRSVNYSNDEHQLSILDVINNE